MASRQCATCGQWTPETDISVQQFLNELDNLPASVRALLVAGEVFSCMNTDCGAYHLTILYSHPETDPSGAPIVNPRSGLTFRYRKPSRVRVVPEFLTRPLPDYVPEPIRQDYIEACRIENLSPKASATLSRRCLQGIIRDFYGISKPTLAQEIDALKSIIRPELWDALHSLRSIGNIGAHPEADVNTIIDVEPDEAGELIGLIELLVKETYVSRHDSDERLARIKAIAAAKAAEKLTGGKQPSVAAGQSSNAKLPPKATKPPAKP